MTTPEEYSARVTWLLWQHIRSAKTGDWSPSSKAFLDKLPEPQPSPWPPEPKPPPPPPDYVMEDVQKILGI